MVGIGVSIFPGRAPCRRVSGRPATWRSRNGRQARECGAAIAVTTGRDHRATRPDGDRIHRHLPRSAAVYSSNSFGSAPPHRLFPHLEGRTRHNIERNPQVCFGLAEMGRLLPADTALEFSMEYSGVCAFGRARVLEDGEEKLRALQGLLDKYFPDLKPGEDYRGITKDEMDSTAVFAINVEAWSGKRKSVAE
jgi:nitroimidazol reductase NimA-like FMN-containing flavoprotein (pyridoxamine 5'-phosphate oxidase superfamily)